ncbi:MAG TPA: glycosyltransferase [Candidatus Magasanikbacteria bacterium]|nr:glycosyltransferase [Candidatus Magasanikbacteria bacterium]
MDNIGGAEMVTLILAKELKADIYTTNIDREKIKKMGFDDIHIISIGKVPLNAPFRQQFAFWRFRFLNLKQKYDYYLICGDWAMSGAVKNKPNLWYVHSPIREIWDLYEYTRKNTVPFLLRPFFDLWVFFNRYYNKKYVAHAEKIVCNSENTRHRVKKFLNREAEVINPPIETQKFKYSENGHFWLSVNRLINHKRIEMQLAAFAKMPDKRLIIVGSYEDSKHFRQYANFILKNKPDNVEIKSWTTREELIELYARCRGFIATARDEDFGMTVLEAMAAGKPVIAANEGGYKETVINDITGKLIDDINEEKIIFAVNEVEKDPSKYKDACLAQASKFDTAVFVKKIKQKLQD